jgi:hypothetical protein
MASVAIIKGTYLSSSLKQKEFEGKKDITVQLDVYQPSSPLNDKTVSIKVEDVDMLQKFHESYSMGDSIEVECTINAYKNQAYYKLLRLVS